MGDWLLLTGREAMVAAIHDPATAMSTGLAEKLDALSGEEWDELTRWLSARTSIAAESLGIVLVRRQALASALFARYGDVVMARPSVRVPSGPATGLRPIEYWTEDAEAILDYARRFPRG